MCLAIYKPEGIEVPHKHLENGFRSHGDGAGFAWAIDGALHVKKGIFDEKEAIEQYEQIKQYPCLIHFRNSTTGKINEANCHPFLFNNGKLALIHNGVLPIKPIPECSDTATFVKLVLEPLVKDLNVPIDHPSLRWLLTICLRKSENFENKVCIMNEQGEVYIFGEDSGTWLNKVWYSNYTYNHVVCRKGWTGSEFRTPIPSPDNNNTTTTTTNTTIKSPTQSTQRECHHFNGIENDRNWKKKCEENNLIHLGL